MPKNSPGPGSQHLPGFGQVGVEIGPEATDQPQDNGVVIKDVGQQNHTDRVLKLERRRIELK